MARTPACSHSVDAACVRSNCFGIVLVLHGDTTKAVYDGSMVSLPLFFTGSSLAEYSY